MPTTPAPAKPPRFNIGIDDAVLVITALLIAIPYILVNYPDTAAINNIALSFALGCLGLVLIVAWPILFLILATIVYTTVTEPTPGSWTILFPSPSLRRKRARRHREKKKEYELFLLSRRIHAREHAVNLTPSEPDDTCPICHPRW